MGGGVILGAAGARTLGPHTTSFAGVSLIASPVTDGVMNDASLLSSTPIFKHTIVKEATSDRLVAVLRAELKAATSEGRAVNLAAARHSMGGHSIPYDGRALTLDSPKVSTTAGSNIYTVQAGTRWRDVISALDPLGFAPKVMQSNNDFGVASTFSVNAHGWAVAHGPMGSTVQSVGMLLADGTFVRASRVENADLFAAAMGGYGLIGLITDLEVEWAENQLLEPTFEPMAADAFAAAFSNKVTEVPMAYGRLNVDRDGFLQDAMMVSYRPILGEVPAAEGSGFLSKLSRHIFRAQVGNEWVKHRRWGIETGIGASLAGATSRNSLFNEPVATLDDNDPTRTDILHEYFVAPDKFSEFLQLCRAIIPDSYQELLNITLRWVEQDTTSLLSYAPDGPRIAAVLLFSQEMTARGEANMAWMTGRLIDAVQAIGGSYYLPYRPHATVDQFRAGYARAEEFIVLKRRVDPGLVLRNGFWDRYLAGI